MRAAVIALRQRLALLESRATPRNQGLFGLGLGALDRHLGGGLASGGLHEVGPHDSADAAAAAGFALALARRAGGEGRKIVWVRHRLAEMEVGCPYGPGLAELGLDPAAVMLVAARTPAEALRAAHEGLRCAGLGAVVIELWGAPVALDLTASRRLKLAAARAGVTGILLQADPRPWPGAAESCWRIAAGPSLPLAAGAPGPPVFDIELERHRSRPPGQWRVEWNRDTQRFTAPATLSRPVAAASADRPAAPGEGRRRAG